MMTLPEAIAGVGWAIPRDIVWDGQLHRFPTDDRKRHSKDGWYIAFDDHAGRAAAFGSWRDNSKHTWSNGTGRQLSADDWAEIERQKVAAEAADKQRKGQAATRAKRIYEQASVIGASAYLERKRIGLPAGVRFIANLPATALGFEGTHTLTGLIVPIADRKGAIQSLQIILEDGSKLFMKDGATAGMFHALGNPAAAKRILIAEGLATAQSLHEATGDPVIVAFSSGNLPRVADAVRGMNATADIVICADNDAHGAGERAGRAAASAARGRMALPDGVKDFNDLHVASGLDAVRQAVRGETASTVEAGDEDDLWKADLITSRKTNGDQVIACRTHNLVLTLQNAPPFKGKIRFNEFSGMVSIDGRDMDDVGPVDIKTQLEKDWIDERIKTSDVVEALMMVAHRHPYHPVREWLHGLVWDGVPRVESFMARHLKVPDDRYHRAVAFALFVSAVLRVFKPGCKVDTMTILQGMQGLGKTKMWVALFSPWYAEVTDNINTKDFLIGLSGVWCADFGELDQFSKADSTRIKQIITSQSDNYRGLYGRGHSKHPRQCIFVGGTNADHWQTDPTGGRRFLPVRVHEHIDVEAIEREREQLFAEAVFAVKADPGRWWHIPDATDHQEQAYVGDTWDEIVSAWLSQRYLALGPRDDPHRLSTTVASVLEGALHVEPGKQTRADQTRVGYTLRRVGWAPRQEMVHGVRIRIYRPTPGWLDAMSDARRDR